MVKMEMMESSVSLVGSMVLLFASKMETLVREVQHLYESRGEEALEEEHYGAVDAASAATSGAAPAVATPTFDAAPGAGAPVPAAGVDAKVATALAALNHLEDSPTIGIPALTLLFAPAPDPAIAPLPEMEDLVWGSSPRHKSTALHAAAALGDLCGVRRQLQAGANPFTRDALGDTAVHMAARGGHVHALQALLAACGNVEEGANVRGWQLRTPLHTAAAKGHLAEAAALLDAGAGADARDEQGNSPLHLAAAVGQRLLAALLLAEGARVDAVNAWGRSALDSAAHMGHACVVRLLLCAGAGAFSALCTAAARGHVPVLRLLVDAGASVRAADHCGKTALHYAAENDQVEAAETLLALGAAVDARDDNGHSPLLFAARSGGVDVVQLLLERDALVAERSPALVFLEAARSGQGHVVELLLKEDAVRPVAPLEEAVESAGSGCVVWAVANAAPERFKAAAKKALLVAAQNGCCEAVCAITCAVATVGWQDTLDDALCLAAAGGHDDCVSALLYAGADVRCSCHSPLDAATKRGAENV